MKRRDPSLKFDEDSHKVKNTRLSLSPKAVLLNKMKEKARHELFREDAEDDDDNELTSREVSHGFHLVKGKMDHGMEDYIVAETRKVNSYELGLYAIFDGHSGPKVAEYLQSHLFDNILNEPDFWTKPKKAVKRAYKTTDDEILVKVVGSKGGSTAVTAILINGEKLIVANVGDSQAVLCRDGLAKQITVDHDPQGEKDAVESRGGCVLKRPGNLPRVDGQLARTRAFGDRKLKEHITSEPDITVKKIDAETDFVILASDGCGNRPSKCLKPFVVFMLVMSNQEAYDCIEELDDAQEAVEELIEEALSGKSCDDISCIVVVFH